MTTTKRYTPSKRAYDLLLDIGYFNVELSRDGKAWLCFARFGHYNRYTHDLVQRLSDKGYIRIFDDGKRTTLRWTLKGKSAAQFEDKRRRARLEVAR